MMPLAEKVLRLNASLSAQYGFSFAYEDSKRHMLGVRYGRLPGRKSVGRVERELAKKGRLIRERIYSGGRLPNGKWIDRGYVRVRLLSRQVARANARAAKKAARAAQVASERPPAPATPRSTPEALPRAARPPRRIDVPTTAAGEPLLSRAELAARARELLAALSTPPPTRKP